MVQNKRQFLDMVGQWTAAASQDVATKLREFMSETQGNVNEVADALDMTPNEVRDILNGTSELTLVQFAKLLIGSDHVIEIKSLEEAMPDMMRGFPAPHEMPRGSRMPMPPRVYTNVFGRDFSAETPLRDMHINEAEDKFDECEEECGFDIDETIAHIDELSRSQLFDFADELGIDTSMFDELSRKDIATTIIRRYNNSDKGGEKACCSEMPHFDMGRIASSDMMRGFCDIGIDNETANKLRVGSRPSSKKDELMSYLDKAMTEHPELIETLHKHLEKI